MCHQRQHRTSYTKQDLVYALKASIIGPRIRAASNGWSYFHRQPVRNPLLHNYTQKTNKTAPKQFAEGL